MNQAEAIVRAMIDAVSAGDIDGMLSHLAPDVEVVEPESLAYGGVYRGIDSFLKDVIGVMFEKAAMGATEHILMSSGDTVAVSMQSTMTSHRTGKVLHMPYMELYTVRDGKITRIEAYPQDTKKIVEFWDTN